MREVVHLQEYESKEIRLTEEEFQILKNDFWPKITVYQIENGRFKITAKQFVGNRVLPKHVFIINPKILNLNFFLMLFFTYNLTPDFNRKEWKYSKEQGFLEVIITRFLEDIERLVKRGISKDYIECEENLRYVKGRILIAQNFRKNPILKNRIFCRYSDFTSDTLENRIIKFTLNCLSRTPFREEKLQRKVKQTIHFFESVSFVPISTKNFPEIRYTRLNEHYRPIVNMCQLIIQNTTLNFQETGEIRYSSFLIDMNALFERFLLGFLKGKIRKFSIRGAGRGTSEYSLDIIGEIRQNPDIMIRKDGEDVLVIDAKYKQLQTDEYNRTELITSDVRQVWSYCLTPKPKLPFGIIVYPKHELLGRHKERYSMKLGVTIIIKVIDLAKSTIEEFLQECNQFAFEIENLIERQTVQC